MTKSGEKLPTVGETIEHLVEQSDVVDNPAEFAAKLGKGRSLVSRWMSDQRQPSAEDIIKIAQILKVRPDQILGFDNGLFGEVPRAVRAYIEANEGSLHPEVSYALERVSWSVLGEPEEWMVKNIAASMRAVHAANQARVAKERAEQAALEAERAAEFAIEAARGSAVAGEPRGPGGGRTRENG